MRSFAVLWFLFYFVFGIVAMYFVHLYFGSFGRAWWTFMAALAPVTWLLTWFVSSLEKNKGDD